MTQCCFFCGLHDADPDYAGACSAMCLDMWLQLSDDIEAFECAHPWDWSQL